VVTGLVVFAIEVEGRKLTEVFAEARIFISSLRPTLPREKEDAQSVPAPPPAPPAIPPVPIMPAMPFEFSAQSNAYNGWPPSNETHQASVSDVPLPTARPDLRVIEGLRKSLRTDGLNNSGTQNGEIERQDRPAEQTGGIKRQSATTPQSIKSEIDARKKAAAELEQNYADANVAITTHVSGLNATVLNLDYPQFTDVTVQKIMAVDSFTTALARQGFKTIVFAGDQNKVWSFPLKPSSPENTVTQQPAPGDGVPNPQPGPGPNE
jgi:hypothetical protein